MRTSTKNMAQNNGNWERGTRCSSDESDSSDSGSSDEGERGRQEEAKVVPKRKREAVLAAPEEVAGRRKLLKVERALAGTTRRCEVLSEQVEDASQRVTNEAELVDQTTHHVRETRAAIAEVRGALKVNADEHDNATAELREAENVVVGQWAPAPPRRCPTVIALGRCLEYRPSALQVLSVYPAPSAS